MSFDCYNGTFLPTGQPGLSADNRSYKWGDGVFETMKVCKGKLLLSSFHFDRLFTSIQLLQMQLLFTVQELEANIISLCHKNGCAALGRVRLAVYRDHDNGTGYTIEATPLDQKLMQWQEEGLQIDTYPYARKACDVWANLKTANYLPYVMAARYAEEKGLQECIVLNSYNHICDASKANIFIIKGKIVFTPALDQGCINGVMRRFLIQALKEQGWMVKQGELTEDMLLQADECFLTNAIQGIRWVRQYRDKHFACMMTKEIFDTFLSTYWR